MTSIPFNRPHLTGNELQNIMQAHANGKLAGDGQFTKLCEQWIEEKTGCSRSLLTHSCTAALEMSALLLDLKAGDEIIMPSFTFVSTANAFVLRGAVPVFVDIREDKLNINESLIESAITPKTKAIVVVHYAGVSCEMDAILAIAKKYKLVVIEDAAQGVMASYKGRALGSLGDMGAFSFHETKNIQCGEGGALLINNPIFAGEAEIIREKGTDRSRFFRGQVDKYTWQSVGSSYLPGELLAAFLYAQMRSAQSITQMRLKLWERYHTALAPLEKSGDLRRPIIPPECVHNAHMYYLIVRDETVRSALIQALKAVDVMAVIHYVPLHNAPAGKRFSRTHGELTVTEDLSARLLRLPLWIGLIEEDQDLIIATVKAFFQ